VELVGAGPWLHASAAERFGLTGLGAAPEAPAAGPRWRTPEGWTELPAGSLRLASFRVAGDPRAECSLTRLAGDAGGLAANVNRWREQMSAPPLSAQAIAALPRHALGEREAVLLDVEGTWRGMGGDAAGEGYRLLGLLAIGTRDSEFLKLVGPASVLAGEEPAFLELARSIDSVAGAGRAADAGRAPHGAHGSAPATGGELGFEPPEGWRLAPARPFRAVGFTIATERGGDDAAECQVTILRGDGGGVDANLARWRRQMGLAERGEDERVALRTHAFLGVDGVLAELRGDYRDGAGTTVPDAVLLGAVASVGGRSVFVKLVGSAADAERLARDFAAFTASLEIVP